MNMNRIILALAILMLATVPTVADCDGTKHAETATASCCSGAEKADKPCCAAAGEGADCNAHAAEAAKLAAAAENGCQASMGKLIAMARESGHEEAVTLAAKAEGGCKASETALIAMAKSLEQTDEHPAAQSASMDQLAEWAEQGCQKSAASLIAAAKESEDAKTAKLARAAEGGCEKSKAALIAMVKESEASEESGK